MAGRGQIEIAGLGGSGLWADGSADGRLDGAGTEACDPCLRRARLLAVLAPYLEKSASASRGRRVAELLAQDDEDLISAIAPRRVIKIRTEANAITPGALRAEAEAVGCWSTCKHREDYPAGLRNLGDGPGAIFGRGDRGHLAGIGTDRAVTVVGARRASSYGIAVARDLARELAMAGLTVVSGLALGIDGAAHNGALEAGVSCAVLGGGVDQIYPPRHRGLYERHLAGGLILSEMPVGTKVWRWMFPARNRLMAAMAGMTIVVEARRRSGSLITATMAQDLGRDLGAVPGPVTSTVSQGPNDLLAQGACLVRGAQDVLDAMLGVGQRAATTGPALEPWLATALEAFERADGSFDGFAMELDKTEVEPALALARLELMGYLSRRDSGGWTRTALPVSQSERSTPVRAE